jgi:hypothetical protein
MRAFTEPQASPIYDRAISSSGATHSRHYPNSFYVGLRSKAAASSVTLNGFFKTLKPSFTPSFALVL